MPAPNSMIEMNGALNACGHDPGSNVPGSFLGADNEQDARILEAMDRLRELGVDRQYDLPQIIVCGAQSAGKSSVLESIVQIPFPRSDKTCTKYATKVTIVRNPTISVAVKIQPDRGRPTDEIKRLRAFERAAKGQEGGSKLGKFMAEAHIEIFAGSAAGKLITRDVLLVTISAPNHRPLQLLDLPGLIEYDHMNLGNEAEIRGMVEEYMRMKQSMILAVVKATDDINNQKVLTLCRDHDREGTRTLGIITRPDVAEIGQADALIQVIEGNDPDFRFKHGWHVLRNRNNQELLANTTQAQRNCAEKALFERYPWNRVSEPNWGIENLIARLRRMLFSVSKRELPALRKTFLDRVYHLQKEYADLGGDEFSDVELGHGFKRAIGRLRKATRDHSNGEYRSDIHKYPPESPIRLRSRIVDQDEIFHDKLYRDGHTWKTLIRPSTSGIESTSKAATQTRYKDLAAEVTEVTRQLQRSRGTELPGFLNPKRINDLFWQMSDGWNAITEEHIGDIYQCCETYFNTITPVVFKPTTGSSDGFSNAGVVAARFVRLCIIPQLEKSRENATDELQKLENDRLSFTRNVDVRFLKDSRRHHQQRDFRRAVRAVHEIESLSQGEAGSLDHNTYARHSGLFSEQQHDEDVAETYLDAMWSHYLIDRDIYLANVLRQVIERHFLRNLEEIIPEYLDLQTMRRLVRAEDNRDTLAGSRFHSDRAEYREAATLLRDFPKTATDRLEAVLELARVIKTQGYCRDPLSILLDEVLPTPDGTATTREELLGIQMKMEVCRLKIFGTASFDAPLREGEDLRIRTLDFAALIELEPATSTFDRLVSVSRHREAFELMHAYNVFLESAPAVRIMTLDFETWSGMVQCFLSSPDLPPLFKANAMVFLANNARERLDEAYVKDIKTTAKTIYTKQGHTVGAMDLRFQQVSRVLKKDHRHLTDELLEELKGYFVKYEQQDHVKAHDRAAKVVELIQGTFPREAATARNILLQAKLNLYEQNNSDPKDLEEILSFADSETTRDRAAGLGLQAAKKAEMIVAQITSLLPEQRRYWMERMLACVNDLDSNSEDGDIRMAGLCQVQGMKLMVSIQETDTKALADTVVFTASASRWQSIIIYTGRERGWVAGDQALAALEDAENARAVERADMTALASFEAVSHRQHFTSLKGLSETYQRPLRGCEFEGRISELWEWTQKAKPRSMSDQLGVDSLVPAGLRGQAIRDPGRRELMEEAEALSFRIAESPASVRLRLRGELELIHKQMAKDALLKAVIDIKNGTPVTSDQIQQLGIQMKRSCPGRDVKFVDWLEPSNKLWVLVLGCEKKTPGVMQCPVSPAEVAAWKREWLDAQPGEIAAFEKDDFYSEDDPEFSLCSLDGLVAPLDEFTKPGDLVVFCPTGVLHSIPLHALLEVADGSITVRDMFKLKLKAPHMIPIACNSASQGVAAGDEPLGIVTALLCAGAGSVLGTIWPTASRTGRYFTNEFYTNSLEKHRRRGDTSTDVGGHAAVIDLAEVSQRVVLALRRNIDTTHPYHWAAFVLRGSWFMNQKEKEGVASS
ncbi:hypothetical protein ACJZ2D_014881 [Fusarium nematophilum]